MDYSITKDGKPLDKKLYTIDEKAKSFSTKESGLVLDFSGLSGWSFKTSSHCTFKTGSCCTFKTGSHCTFKTGWNCTFDTGSNCTFKTSSNCTFKTGYDCVVVRHDIYEVIELKGGVKIKLNNCGVEGYTIVEDEEDEKEEEKEIIKIGDLEFDKDEVEERLKDLKPIPNKLYNDL